MKRIAVLLLFAICLAAFAYAQDSGGAEEMTGTICDAWCVTHQGKVATCQRTCAKKSGVPVFVNDRGEVRQIMNQDVCQSHMGRRVKMIAVPEEPKFIPTVSDREMWLRVQDLHDMPSAQ